MKKKSQPKFTIRPPEESKKNTPVEAKPIAEKNNNKSELNPGEILVMESGIKIKKNMDPTVKPTQKLREMIEKQKIGGGEVIKKQPSNRARLQDRDEIIDDLISSIFRRI